MVQPRIGKHVLLFSGEKERKKESERGGREGGVGRTRDARKKSKITGRLLPLNRRVTSISGYLNRYTYTPSNALLFPLADKLPLMVTTPIWDTHVSVSVSLSPRIQAYIRNEKTKKKRKKKSTVISRLFPRAEMFTHSACILNNAADT